ncbi:hypothetical protein Tter_1154 [Thermobaculum terrenum ATCC BAA-798]|uniref:Microcin J25-processing protein McjB C-terminal domain-containing protein n=1 Tax=Thermobaculum terrenum (strain ATCC BAA-798 / CCMEE 7001 / YNP1) TaxID=525904 RepID=D1CB98_THET1|nr:hypothetical protein Tter_1154 [Thermobaculum terrenum ATCC BAA-798]
MKSAVDLLRAFLLLIRAKLLVKSGSWMTFRDYLPKPASPSQQHGSAYVEHITRICNIAARLLPARTECLERSFVVCSMLRRRGISSDLCIGATRVPPLLFHAWVEVDDRVVNDTPLLKQGFLVIYRL